MNRLSFGGRLGFVGGRRKAWSLPNLPVEGLLEVGNELCLNRKLIKLAVASHGETIVEHISRHPRYKYQEHPQLKHA